MRCPDRLRRGHDGVLILEICLHMFGSGNDSLREMYLVPKDLVHGCIMHVQKNK